jgi:hypothetical protein
MAMRMWMAMGMGMEMGIGMEYGNGNRNRNKRLASFPYFICPKSYMYPVCAMATYTSLSEKVPWRRKI